MRVLHIVGFSPEIGGPYAFIKDLVISLSNKGLEVYVLSPKSKDNDIAKLYDGFPAFLNVTYISKGFLSSLIPSFSTRWEKAIKNMLPNIDLLHVHGIFDHYTFVANKFSKDKPIVISLHGSIMSNAISIKGYLRKTLYLASIGKSIIRKASAIHLLNQYEKAEFLNKFKTISKELKDKIFVVPPGINFKEIENIPLKGSFKQRYPILKNKRYILFLGRINRVKGIDILIEAFKKLTKTYNDLHLIIAGPDNEGYGEKVKGWLNNTRLQDRVEFTGTLVGEDKIEAFLDAELFVLPSYSDSFPLALLEAMSCGTPAVISNKVGIYREVERNKAGIVVETNPESLFNGIRTVLDDEKLGLEIAKNGRELVSEHYNIDKVADMMTKAYEEILGNC